MDTLLEFTESNFQTNPGKSQLKREDVLNERSSTTRLDLNKIP